MKNIKYLLIPTLFLLPDIRLSAQCNASAFSQECVTKVQEGFTFLKSFTVDGQNGSKEKVEYSYVFSKDTEYYLNVCPFGDGNDGIIVTLYDSNRKLTSSNFSNGKMFPGLIFECKSTGIYYISYTFKEPKNSCGGSVLAFKR
jgi:hypothetical protein